MKKSRITLAAIAAVLLSFLSGCVVAEGPRRGIETYYYYPNDEVYYYPNARRYYWLDRGEWRNGPQPPSRFVLRDRDRVRLDMDHEPIRDHDKIKREHPPKRQEEQREERREDRDRDRSS